MSLQYIFRACGYSDFIVYWEGNWSLDAWSNDGVYYQTGGFLRRTSRSYRRQARTLLESSTIGVREFVPSWKSLLLNLRDTPADVLTRFASALRWALTVLQSVKEPLTEIEGILRGALQGIDGLSAEREGQWRRGAWFIMQMIFHKREDMDAQRLMRAVLDEAGRSKFREPREEIAMQSYAEFLEQKGEARGELRGER